MYLPRYLKGVAAIAALQLAALVLSGTSAAQTAVAIAPGQAQTGSLKPGDEISYEFEVDAGRAYLIEASQGVLDLVVTIDCTGLSAQFNSPLGHNESEFVVVQPRTAAICSVTLGSNNLSTAVGPHTVQLSTPSVSQIEGWLLLSDAAHAYAAGEAATAESLYRDASAFWAARNEHRQEAFAQFSAGVIRYWNLFDWEASRELASSAADIYSELNEDALRANAKFLEGAAIVEIASGHDYETAAATFATALSRYDDVYAIHESLGNTYDMAEVLSYRGVAQFNRGNFELALTAYRDAAAMFSSTGHWGKELEARQNIGVLHAEQGYSANAIQTYEYIIERLPAGADDVLKGTVLNNLGAAYRYYGDVDSALERFSAALDLHEQLEDDWSTSISLRGLGSTYFSFGELELASVYLDRALPVSERAGDRRGQAAILTHLGNIAYLNADFPGALALHEQSVDRTASITDRSRRLMLVSRDLIALGRYDDADAAAEEALQLAQESGVPLARADAFRAKGEVASAQSRYLAANRFLTQAIDEYEALGQTAGASEAYIALARSAHAAGELGLAIDYAEASLERMEALRNAVASPELRALFSANRRSVFETYVELLMARYRAGDENQRDLMAALAATERARARMTVELIREASIYPAIESQRIPTSRQQQLVEQLAALEHRRYRLSSMPAGQQGIDEAINSLLANMADVENELNLLDTQSRRDRGMDSLASLTSADPTHMMRSTLGADSALLQYSLGTERSYVFVLTADDLRVFELADRNTIESAAKKAFEGLRDYRPGRAARQILDADLERLAELVLSPALLQVNQDRLVIAADGALQYVPFAVLPAPADEGALMASFEVVSVPSLSALTAQRRRGPNAISEKILAVFADPVLTSNDPRIGDRQTLMASVAADAIGVIRRSSLSPTLQRLPSTNQEAKALANLVPEDARLIATGFDVNREALLTGDLANYRYLHFATHGLIDSRYPALSAIALSQYDKNGVPLAGFLRLHDVYRLDLNADLVVLSACETGLGREIHGEGLVGLTQGFMYAGARSLLVSLWQVEDRATAELMTHFYTNLLEHERRPAEALQLAQEALAADPRWSDPFFWGGFVLSGDW